MWYLPAQDHYPYFYSSIYAYGDHGRFSDPQVSVAVGERLPDRILKVLSRWVNPFCVFWIPQKKDLLSLYELRLNDPRYTQRLASKIETMGGVRYMFLTHKDDVADHEKCPRYTQRLASKIETMGGVRYMFLTHKYVEMTLHKFPLQTLLDDLISFSVTRDDVADHEKWSKRFRFFYADVEIKLEGNGPWNLGRDIELVYTPGHSEVSACACHIPMQLKSVRLLLELDFEWILPGHGRRAEFRDYEEKNSVLEAFLDAKLMQDY
ncbi:hypothetical protein C3L33_12555, partial [Rhododendron williamsianum]